MCSTGLYSSLWTCVKHTLAQLSLNSQKNVTLCHQSEMIASIICFKLVYQISAARDKKKPKKKQCNWGQSSKRLWKPKKQTATTQSKLVKAIRQLWKISNSDWLMTPAIHHYNVLLLSDEWVNSNREQGFFSSLFRRNMSPKPFIICLQANFSGKPVTVQPIFSVFPCIEQCVSWLLLFS